MPVEKDHIIKKLFEGSLTPEERKELNRSGFINDSLRKQWEEVSGESMDPVREERILNGIMQRMKKKERHSRYSLYRYGMAAMIAVCMLLSALLLMKTTHTGVMYVMNTGYQSMDSVRLADGTKVMLGAGSRLTYPQEFSDSRREVMLSGQAFFEVTPDKKHPFVVKTSNMDITVLGTSFEVFSYDGDKQAETILLTGKVKVEIPDNKALEGKIYRLASDEKLTYDEEKGVSLAKVDADAYSAWRQGKRMSFKNETLEMILDRLEKWYGQEIECNSQVAQHYRFTFTVHSEPLELILNYISHSAPLTYRMVSNNRYLIEEKK